MSETKESFPWIGILMLVSMASLALTIFASVMYQAIQNDRSNERREKIMMRIADKLGVE